MGMIMQMHKIARFQGFVVFGYLRHSMIITQVNAWEKCVREELEAGGACSASIERSFSLTANWAIHADTNEEGQWSDTKCRSGIEC